MTRFPRFLVAAVLALALPLQTVGAATMTLCARDHAPQMQASMAAVDAGGGGHESCHSAKPAHDTDCSQCSLCHLACASVLPSGIPTMPDVLQPVYLAAATVDASSYLPDPIRKPPRGDLR